MLRHVAIVFCLSSVAANLTSRIAFGDDVVGQPLVYRGNVTPPSKIPWHAGIWRPNGPVYDQECGGTLIAPNLVLTAAHCFWDYKLRKVLPDLHDYKVALGKVYREWHLDASNPTVQRMDVRRVILDSRFDGYVRRHLENDIALVELTTNATLTDYVKLASVDWTEGAPTNGSVGVVAGWGYTEEGDRSHELRSIELPYIDHDSCYQSLGAAKFKKLLTTDKFCAGFINQGKSVCQGDSGGGFVVVDNVTHIPYVRGIVSIDFRPSGYPKSRCYALHYTAFTNVGVQRYLTWIREHRPEAPAVPCPSVFSDPAAQSVTCLHHVAVVDCSRAMVEDTVAVIQCKTDYFAGNETSKTSRCRRDGSWTNDDVTCKPRIGCGKQGPISTAVVDREKVRDGELPWNVMVFHSVGTSLWLSACYGTLITPRHVITSAWCVGDGRTNKVHPATDLTLAGRKLTTNYDTVEPNAQLRGVTSVIRHEEYDHTNQVHDIAILVANQSFVLSSHVTVACLDWSSQLPSRSSTDVLIAAAWRRGINNRHRLLVSAERYHPLDEDRCRASAENYRRQFITADKICARTVGTDTCHDPYGSGLMLHRGGRHYLTGVRSALLASTPSPSAPTGYCHINILMSYTNVTQHMAWISTLIPVAYLT